MNLTDQIEFKSFDKIITKLKEFEEKHKWIDYIIAPVIVAIILLTVYAIKGVYPFGRNTIAYYDMPSQYIPFYSYAWDFWHGKSGLYLNWYIGLGTAMEGAVGNYVLFPTNIFLLFTKRDNILYSISILLIIQMMLSAFSMSFYCKEKYNILYWTIASGIMYACCGYVIQYYSNIFFLDYCIILPFIVWSFEKLLYEHKPYQFICFLLLAFIPSFQFALMIVLYLLFKAYIIYKCEPERVDGYSIRLFIMSGVVVALISCVIMYPAIIIVLNSTRIDANEGFNYISVLKDVYSFFRKEKQFMMYGSEIAVAIFVILIIRKKKNISRYIENLSILAILTLPILHEGINVLWHLGKYKHFPMRFGFMITFEMLIFVGKYLKNEEFITIKIIGRVAKLTGLAAIPFMSYILYAFFIQFLEKSLNDLSPFMSYWIYFISLTFFYLVVFVMDSKATRIASIMIFIIIQSFLGCYGLIAPRIGFDNGERIEFLKRSLESKKLFDHSNYIERIKCNIAEYEPNYGLIIEQPSISAWIYGVPKLTEKELMDNMGYHGIQSSVMDGGGTIFTDALLGVKNVLSSFNPDERLYIPQNNDLYRCKYVLPFGIVSKSKEIEDVNSKGLEHSNYLFEKFTGNKELLIDIKDAKEYEQRVNILTEEETKNILDKFIEELVNYNSIKGISTSLVNEEDKSNEEISNTLSPGLENNKESNEDNETKIHENKEYILSVPVTGEKTLYLEKNDEFQNTVGVIVNERCILCDSYLSKGEHKYPNSVYNGILALGTYEDEVVDLRLYISDSDIKGLKIGLLDLDILNEGIDELCINQDLNIECDKKSMHVSGNINSNGTLYLPITYSPNWKVKVNGSYEKIKPYINGAFIAIDVDKGNIDLQFSYFPRSVILGLVLTFLGIALFLVLIVIHKRKTEKEIDISPRLDHGICMAFRIFVIILLFVMYIIPIYVKLSL